MAAPIKTGRGRRYVYSGIVTIEVAGKTVFDSLLGSYKWQYFGTGVARVFFPALGFWVHFQTAVSFDPTTGQISYTASVTPHSAATMQGHGSIRFYNFVGNGVPVVVGPFALPSNPYNALGTFSLEMDLDEYLLPGNVFREFPRIGGTMYLACDLDVAAFSHTFTIAPIDVNNLANLGSPMDYLCGAEVSALGSNSPGHLATIGSVAMGYHLGEIQGSSSFDGQLVCNWSHGPRVFLFGSRSHYNDYGSTWPVDQPGNPDEPLQARLWQKPPKRFTLDGRAYGWADPYTTQLRVDWHSRAGKPPTIIYSPNVFQASDTQHFSQVIIGYFETGAKTGFLINLDEYSLSTANFDGASLLAAGEDQGDTAILFFGPLFQPYILSHDEELPIDVGQTSDWLADEFGFLDQRTLGGIRLTASLGDASMQRTWAAPGETLEAYRYLRFHVIGEGQDALPFVIRIGQKEWDVQAGQDTAQVSVEIDLCCPDRTLSEMPLDRDSKYPADANARAATEARLSGIDSLLLMRFSGVAFGCKLTLEKMECYRNSDPILGTVIPFNFENHYSPAADRQTWFVQRKLLATVDGKQALEMPWYVVIRASGAPPAFSFSTLDDLANAVSQIPGWTMVPAASSYPSTGLGPEQLANTFGGDGFIANPGFVPMLDLPLAGGSAEIPSMLSFSSLDAYPGCGDLATGAGYGVDSNIVCRFAKVFRGVTHGIALDGEDLRPIGAAQILLEDEADLSSGGTGVSLPNGYFETSLPYMKAASIYDVSVDAQIFGLPIDTIARKKHRAGAETRKVGGDDIALLRCKPGYFIAYTQEGALLLKRSWNEHLDLVDNFTIDEQTDCSEPRLEWFRDKDFISVLYRRGKGTTEDPYSIWRKTSFDYGASWISDPLAGGQYGIGMIHARERYLPRTKERALFFMTADRRVSVEIFSAQEVSQGIFPAGGLGIGGAPADSTSFDADLIEDGDGIDVAMFVGGVIQRFRSYEDCRSWVSL